MSCRACQRRSILVFHQATASIQDSFVCGVVAGFRTVSFIYALRVPKG
jgi:hypothetical protein